jgi:hypothetical protein
MADLKISALTASTTPLAGTEVLPIVQSSTTKQVSVANLTAGRAISATQLTLTTGNLIVANGQGIDFSATSGSGTSELLADYEEGTWTPVDQSGASLTFTSPFGAYTKVGDTVTAFGRVTFPTTASALTIVIGGLPFVVANNSQPGGGFIRLTATGRNDTVVASATTSQFLFYDNLLNAAVNLNYSDDRVDFVIIYKV